MVKKKDKKMKGTFRDILCVLGFVKKISAKYFVIAGLFTITDTIAPFINPVSYTHLTLPTT